MRVDRSFSRAGQPIAQKTARQKESKWACAAESRREKCKNRPKPENLADSGTNLATWVKKQRGKKKREEGESKGWVRGGRQEEKRSTGAGRKARITVRPVSAAAVGGNRAGPQGGGVVRSEPLCQRERGEKRGEPEEEGATEKNN